MFAECLTPVVRHVMCCYFGMWTRHWPLLNDDSSKKEGKNVHVGGVCVHRAPPGATAGLGRVQNTCGVIPPTFGSRVSIREKISSRDMGARNIYLAFITIMNLECQLFHWNFLAYCSKQLWSR